MTLIECYTTHLKASNRQPDPAQINVIHHYQTLLDEIEREALQNIPDLSLLQKLLQRFKPSFREKSDQDLKARHSGNRGLYVWGSVGRGKTYLMDLFFEYITQPKSRYHYYHFMQMIHTSLRQIKDQENPLAIIAKDIAKTTKILCLDEFFVVDITDAMLLAKLIDNLFKENVYLVTTSNCIPDVLYKNGLQRERFLPTIELIKTRMNVVALDSDTDYRMRHLEQMTVWHVIPNAVPSTNSTQFLKDLFLDLNGHAGSGIQTILLNDRELSVYDCGTHTLYCDFQTLCVEARGAIDYIEIANRYHNVLIENIPQFNTHLENEARRFITMIDEFYDRGVKIAVTAACEIPAIYQGKTLAFEFERTTSRLIEMQSKDYLTRGHSYPAGSLNQNDVSPPNLN